MSKNPTVQELYDLTGKTAFVTGGARNLGFDMALALAEAGADVTITSRNLEHCKQAADGIAKATGRRVVALELDVCHEEEVELAIEMHLNQLKKLDILVNNAGNVISTPETAPLEKRSLKDWHTVIEVNLTGVFLCTKHVVAKAMMPQRSGSIINIASVTGMLGKDRRVYIGTTMGGATIDYHAAKGGVISMTRDIACYLAPHNIRVNCISPGGFWRNQPETFVNAYNERVPMGRMGKDGKEMKGAVVFFASEASSYCTGQNLAIDGGLSSW